jgi:hypothetical protein
MYYLMYPRECTTGYINWFSVKIRSVWKTKQKNGGSVSTVLRSVWLGHGRLDGWAGGNVGIASSSQEKAEPLSWQGSAPSARHHKSLFCSAWEYCGTRACSQRGCSDEPRSCYSMGCQELRFHLTCWMSHDADLVCKWLCRFVHFCHSRIYIVLVYIQTVLCKLWAIFGNWIVHNKEQCSSAQYGK